MVVAASTNSKLIGRNKSGCLWKKGTSQKASNSVSRAKKSWDKKMEERRKMQSLKKRIEELREAKIAAKRKQRVSQKEKEERKKVNEMRSAKYQVINNLAKTKKWHKKTKQTLAKLPAEIFYEKFK